MSATKPVPTPSAADRPLSGGLSKIAMARASIGRTGPQSVPVNAPAFAAPPAGNRRPPHVTKPSTSSAGATADLFTVKVSGRLVRLLYGDATGGKAMLLVQGAAPQAFKLEGRLTFEPEVGMRVSASAVLEQHPKYGPQYRAEIITEEIPVDRAGAVKYMERVLEGVGKTTASKIYDAFGESVYEVLQNEPERLLGVGGINEAKLVRIKESWVEDSAVRDIWTFLGRHGVSGAVAARIYGRFGARAMSVAKQRPYDLTQVEGVGFLTADRIATESGTFRQDSRERMAAAIEFALERVAQQGHTAMPVDALIDAVHELTDIDLHKRAIVEQTISVRVASGDLVARVLDSKLCLTPRSFAESERRIARRIRELTETGKKDEKLAARAQALALKLKDEHQVAAVGNVFNAAVSVITGGPGCGKTTVTKVIAQVADEAGLRVVMCAPTGIAARRTTEATGFKSQTIHTLLRPRQGDLQAFQHNAANPLEGDLFVVDESSMKDAALARAFLEAVPNGSRVVLVGDADQLPSVGPGNVLRDIISSGHVSVARLQTIHRTALDSDIVVNAHEVINGRAKSVNLKGTKDFRFFAASDDNEIRETVLRRYLEMVHLYGVHGVQVLAARWATPVGVDAINDLLRAAVNPAGAGKPELDHHGRTFRLGDRVIRKSNHRELDVSNGEVGIISQVDAEAKRIRVNFGDREVTHDGKQLLALDLAYVITMHKSQGGEYPGVITLVPPSHRFMLNRQLIYTPITRGKKQSDVVGDAETLFAAIAKQGSRRCTGLAAEIRAAFGDPVPAADLAWPRSPAMPSSPALQSAQRASSPLTSTAAPAAAQPTVRRLAVFRRVRP